MGPRVEVVPPIGGAASGLAWGVVKLTLRLFSPAAIASMSELFARQLGARLETWRRDPEMGELIERGELHDEHGVHRYDACFVRGEDGPVYVAGTTELVAYFSQSATTECEDEALIRALEDALRDQRIRRAQHDPLDGSA